MENALTGQCVWEVVQFVRRLYYAAEKRETHLPTNIDIEDMYCMFVLGWNAELAGSNNI